MIEDLEQVINRRESHGKFLRRSFLKGIGGLMAASLAENALGGTAHLAEAMADYGTTNKKEIKEYLLKFPNSDEGMIFVLVPKGRFQMGLSKVMVNELIRESANPVYNIEEVSLDRFWQEFSTSFYIGKYEATNEQYKALMSYHLFEPGKERQPVTTLSLDKMREFCNKLGEAYPKLDIGLPTEKEWEYAARGNELFNYYTWGKDFAEGKANVGSKRLLEVGKKPESDSWCGASDMIGNVAEVCEISEGIYKKELNPNHVAVARGGSYTSNKYDCRTTGRHPLIIPEKDNVGFRIVVRAKNL